MAHAFGPRSPKSYDEARLQLSRLPPEARRERALKLLQGAEPLLLRLGGALRDHYNLENCCHPKLQENRIQHEAEHGKGSWHAGEEDYQVPNETLHGELRYLRQLFSMRFGGDNLEKPSYEFLPFREQTWVDSELISTVARIERSFQQAVLLGITPELVHREARLRAPLKTSATFRYLKSYADPKGMTASAFELDR